MGKILIKAEADEAAGREGGDDARATGKGGAQTLERAQPGASASCSETESQSTLHGPQ